MQFIRHDTHEPPNGKNKNVGYLSAKKRRQSRFSMIVRVIVVLNRTIVETDVSTTCARSSSSESNGRDPFNQNSDRSNRKKWSTSKGGPVYSKLFRLDRTDPIEFWTEISGNFGWMDRAQGSCTTSVDGRAKMARFRTRDIKLWVLTWLVN